MNAAKSSTGKSASQVANASRRYGPEERRTFWEALEPSVAVLAYRYAALGRRAGMTIDDLKQEAALKFEMTIEKFDPAKGELKAFFARVLLYHFLQLGRCRLWQGGDRLEERPEKAAESTAEDALDLHGALDRMRAAGATEARKVDVFWQRQQGKSVAELARQEGVSVGSIYGWCFSVHTELYRLIVSRPQARRAS